MKFVDGTTFKGNFKDGLFEGINKISRTCTGLLYDIIYECVFDG